MSAHPLSKHDVMCTAHGHSFMKPGTVIICLDIISVGNDAASCPKKVEVLMPPESPSKYFNLNLTTAN